MRKLSGTDASFLYNETANTPQHVGNIQYYEVPDELRPTFFQRLRDIYLDRIHLLPYLTSRLQAMPGDFDHPAWVRDVEFDIDEHLHHLTLEGPGSMDQLECLCSELYESVLDRSKPLWETWVIDGLENGHVAILNKTHHACYDGVASVSAIETLGDYSETPEKAEPAPDHFWQSDETSFQQLVRESWINLARYNMDAWIKWPSRVAAGARLAQRLVRDANLVPRPTSAAKVPWNAAITGKRRLAGAVFSLSTLKAIAKATGTKINDVILAITSDALNRYLERHNRVVRGKLIAACPVSLRKPGDRSMNNQVSMMMVSLENDIQHPSDRLRSIHRASVSAKELLQEIGDLLDTDFGSPFLPAALQSAVRVNASGAYANLGTQAPATLVVSNVPGLREQLYTAGAKMIGSTPLSLVVHGSGLNVTVSSYLDRMDVGITAASSVVTDVPGLRDDLVAAYNELVDFVLGPQATEAGSGVSADETNSTDAESASPTFDRSGSEPGQIEELVAVPV